MNNNGLVLTINVGSSSIKFNLFEAFSQKQILAGAFEKIGWADSEFWIEGVIDKKIQVSNHTEALKVVIQYLQKDLSNHELIAIGHRIVDGGPKYHKATVINSSIIADLRTMIPLDPEHLSAAIDAIELMNNFLPNVTQIACFDTAFHHDMPLQAQLLPIPRHYYEQGVRRYGFHGLSCASVIENLKRDFGHAATSGRTIIAHLGNGVSLTAVINGRSVDTTMGLSPAGGVLMSTRSGDIDPGLLVFFAKARGMNLEQINELFNFKSGLLGVSELSADMKKLLEAENSNQQAKDAVDLFCYQIKKAIGSLTSAMGGLDALVFTGGMGEQAPKIRSRVCAGLQFVGLEIDEDRNNTNADLISTGASRVAVRVVRSDEAMSILREVRKLLTKASKE